MSVISAVHAVEGFHLHLVRLLLAGPDKDAFAIKGGCNLRFFFGSPRYSEDIDLDVDERVPVHVLKDKIVRLLESTPLRLALASRGVRVGGHSAPKQTETPQRWKIALQVDGHPRPLPTKVEFSRRGTADVAVLEPLASEVLSGHGSPLFLARHYPLPAALRQKVGALADRREVQARDVFDLGAVLVPRAAGSPDPLAGVPEETLEAAIKRAMALSYADYKAQVVSYLDPVHAEASGSREFWDAIQLQVVDYLDRARSGGGGAG